jgi:hypothetical protein
MMAPNPAPGLSLNDYVGLVGGALGALTSLVNAFAWWRKRHRIAVLGARTRLSTSIDQLKPSLFSEEDFIHQVPNVFSPSQVALLAEHKLSVIRGIVGSRDYLRTGNAIGVSKFCFDVHLRLLNMSDGAAAVTEVAMWTPAGCWKRLSWAAAQCSRLGMRLTRRERLFGDLIRVAECVTADGRKVSYPIEIPTDRHLWLCVRTFVHVPMDAELTTRIKTAHALLSVLEKGRAWIVPVVITMDVGTRVLRRKVRVAAYVKALSIPRYYSVPQLQALCSELSAYNGAMNDVAVGFLSSRSQKE